MNILDAVLATRNPHKVAEVRRILSAAGAPIRLLGLDECEALVPEVVEDGASFGHNAILKAQVACEATGRLAMADDSGLCVEAMSGMPGVFSARWSGAHGDDAGNVRLVLGQISDVPDERRDARFVCAAAAVFPGGRTLVAEGTVVGRLVRQPRGDRGFGYDPIFVPTGFERTTAEMAPEEKDAVSHRGAAFRQLARQIRLAGQVAV